MNKRQLQDRTVKLGEKLQQLADETPCEECGHAYRVHQSAFYEECSWLDVTCHEDYKCTECWKDKVYFS